MEKSLFWVGGRSEDLREPDFDEPVLDVIEISANVYSLDIDGVGSLDQWENLLNDGIELIREMRGRK